MAKTSVLKACPRCDAVIKNPDAAHCPKCRRSLLKHSNEFFSNDPKKSIVSQYAAAIKKSKEETQAKKDVILDQNYFDYALNQFIRGMPSEEKRLYLLDTLAIMGQLIFTSHTKQEIKGLIDIAKKIGDIAKSVDDYYKSGGEFYDSNFRSVPTDGGDSAGD